MIAETSTPLAEAYRKFKTLHAEVLGTPVFAQVELYIVRMSGGFGIENMVAKDRYVCLSALVDILLTKSYSRLPELPSDAPAPAAPAESEPQDSPATADEQVRRIVRQELAAVLETVAKVLRE